MSSNHLNEQEKAKFSLTGAILYGINAVIGAGIFLLPAKIYGGLGPGSIVVMVGSAILVMFLAVCFAEVAGYFNKNGGALQYSKAAFGDFVGFNVGFLGWAVTMIAWSAMAAAFAKIFVTTFPQFKDMNIPISIALIVLLTLMNLAGLKTSKAFTLIATVAKLVPIIAFSVISLFYISQGIQAGNFTPFWQSVDGEGSILSNVASSAVYIFYGFIGFETLPIVAGEMRNPEKNVPRAILTSITIVSFAYMLILSGTIAMLGNGILTTPTPVQDAFSMMVGPVGGIIVSAGMLVSISGLNIGESIMVPRFGSAIAEEGLLPEKLAEKNRNNAPYITILISGAIAIALLLSGSFDQLATLSVVFRFFQYIPTALAVIALRRKYPDKKLVFRVPFGPVIPYIAVILSLVMIWEDNNMNVVYGLVGMAVSIVVYFVLKATGQFDKGKQSTQQEE